MINEAFYATLTPEACQIRGRVLNKKYLILNYDAQRDNLFFFNDEGQWTSVNSAHVRFEGFRDDKTTEEPYIKEMMAILEKEHITLKQGHESLANAIQGIKMSLGKLKKELENNKE